MFETFVALQKIYLDERGLKEIPSENKRLDAHNLKKSSLLQLWLQPTFNLIRGAESLPGTYL